MRRRKVGTVKTCIMNSSDPLPLSLWPTSVRNRYVMMVCVFHIINLCFKYGCDIIKYCFKNIKDSTLNQKLNYMMQNRQILGEISWPWNSVDEATSCAVPSFITS